MTMAVYPFWNAVATQVGRLFRLQGIATAAQINRRVQERLEVVRHGLDTELLMLVAS